MAWVENLCHVLLTLSPLSAVAPSLKQDIRQQHPQCGRKRIEIDHILPVYRGGGDAPENLQPLTLPEHAMKHRESMVKSKNPFIVRGEAGAVRLIVSRMTPEELGEFNQMIKSRRKR